MYKIIGATFTSSECRAPLLHHLTQRRGCGRLLSCHHAICLSIPCAHSSLPDRKVHPPRDTQPYGGGLRCERWITGSLHDLLKFAFNKATGIANSGFHAYWSMLVK